MKSSGSGTPETIRQIYDGDAEGYDESRGRTPFLRRLDLSERDILRYHLVPLDTVLEVGAGTGRLTNELLRVANHVVTIDLSPNMTSVLQQKYAKEKRIQSHLWDVYDLQSLPGYGSFDGLISFRMMPHLKHFTQVLKLFGKAVCPGGLIITDFWNRHSYVHFKKRSAHVYNHYATYNEVGKMVADAGLELIVIEGAGLAVPGGFDLEFLRKTSLKRFAWSLVAICRRPGFTL